MTLLSNILETSADAYKLIDAIVHEATHAMIYMYEDIEQPACRRYSKHHRLKSPWTGRVLTLDQYFQACFVWWGLYNLWSQWQGALPTMEGRVRDLLILAKRGLGQKPVQHLFDMVSEADLTEDAVSALKAIASSFLA
jgi:hypothetical protein